MKCKCCKKEINKENSQDGVCKEYHEEILKRIENKHIEAEITKKIEEERKINNRINEAVQKATQSQRNYYLNELYKNENKKNQVTCGQLFICFLLIFIALLFYFFISVSPSPKPKESKESYLPKCQSITFEELARNPEIHKGKDYVVKGKVTQVQEFYNNDITLLVYITETEIEYIEESYFEDAIYVTYEYESDSEDRILEGDIITIYGKCQGSKTYTSVLGSSNTVPYINALYIDIKK